MMPTTGYLYEHFIIRILFHAQISGYSFPSLVVLLLVLFICACRKNNHMLIVQHQSLSLMLPKVRQVRNLRRRWKWYTLWNLCIVENCVTIIELHSHNHLTALRPLVWDYPGGSVPEVTFTHSNPSWSSNIICQLPASTVIHSILLI